MAATAPRVRPPQGWALGDCPECLQRFAARHPRQLFCCEAHRIAYNDRWRVRGRNLGLLLSADRQTRGGTRGDTVTGRRARIDHQLLCQRYLEEDRAANKGRGRMLAIDFARLRYALGFERA